MYTEYSTWAKCLLVLPPKTLKKSLALASVDKLSIKKKVKRGCFLLSFLLHPLLNCQEGKLKMKRWLLGRFLLLRRMSQVLRLKPLLETGKE